MPIYDIALFTHRGAVRTANEDAVYVGGRIFQENMRDVVTMQFEEAPQTLLIADGIGGQPHGRFASWAALRFLTTEAGRLDGPADCEAALHAANNHLYELMDEPGRVGMGTTVAGFVLQEEGVITFNVGDSRAYRFGRDGLVKLGHIDVVASESERGVSAVSHQITQALGGSIFPLTIIPHVSLGPPLRDGERFLLCTDGLTDALEDDDVENTLRHSTSPANVAQQLVRRAISAGSRDNISVLVGICV